jgi:mono/diheme cytochrome c family protein
MRRIPNPVSLLAVAGAAALAFALAAPPQARADGRAIVTPLPQYVQECGSCHLAFPPGALPAQSWQRLMRDLPNHFGTDASVDAATRKALTDWLTANAGTWKRVAEAPPQDRITTTAWFRRKHDEVAPATFKRTSVKSPANCAACHPRAEQGDFDDDRVRIPR